MSNSKNGKGLKGKDLITIGIFSAIYFVINFAFMLMGGIHPVLWMLMPGFIAVFAGIPFMLMAAKVQKPGAVFLMGLITALIYFDTGQFTLVILVSMASTCILAEIIRNMTKYDSFKGNSASYVIFSLGMVGSPLPIWLFKADFLAQITEQGMPADSACSRVRQDNGDKAGQRSDPPFFGGRRFIRQGVGKWDGGCGYRDVPPGRAGRFCVPESQITVFQY